MGNDCKYSMSQPSLHVQSLISDNNNSIELTINNNSIEADIISSSADKNNFDKNTIEELHKRDSEKKKNQLSDNLSFNKISINTEDSKQTDSSEPSICQVPNNFDLNISLSNVNDLTRGNKIKNKHRLGSKSSKNSKNKNKIIKLENQDDNYYLTAGKNNHFEIKVEPAIDKTTNLSPTYSTSPSSNLFEKPKENDSLNPAQTLTNENFQPTNLKNTEISLVTSSSNIVTSQSTTTGTQFLNNSSSLVDSPISTTSSSVSTSPPVSSVTYQNLVNANNGSILRAALQKSVDSPPTPTSTPSSAQTSTNSTVTYNNFNSNGQIFPSYSSYSNLRQFNGYQSNFNENHVSYTNGYQHHSNYNQSFSQQSHSLHPPDLPNCQNKVNILKFYIRIIKKINT